MGVSSSSSLWRMSSRSTGEQTGTNNLPPITFHVTHGDNICLLREKAVARRTESFCKGVVFSNRTICVNEKVFMKFVEISASWSGAVRFGFTSVDPSTHRGSLPKYACPDLTNKPGYWAKALAEHYAKQDVVLFYFVTASGDVHFGINGEEKGVFFSGVDTRGPLWALMDIYGNTISIEILDIHTNLTNTLHRSVSLSSDVDCATVAFEGLDFTNPTPLNSSDLPVHLSAGIPTELGYFHPIHGQNICLSSDKTIATRNDTEFNQGYVFLNRPITIQEKIFIQILQTESNYFGSLAFGLTNCDPATLALTPLPEDSDFLLDRPEYWVVLKDVVANAPQRGDELAFEITLDGKVLLFKNRNPPVAIMYVDQTQRLWPFFDVYGNTMKIKLLGCAKSSSAVDNDADVSNANQLRVILPPLSYGHVDRSNPLLAARVHRKSLRPQKEFYPPFVSNSGDTEQGLDGCQDNLNNECAVCYEKAIDCVLYACGHMCMCFECAQQLWQRPAGGQCPICRADIRDVIRTYHS